MTKANTASPKKSLEIPSVTHRFFVALQRAYAKIFKIQKNLCAFFDQTASDKACAHDKRTKREKERPERATSSQPRATPWVSVYKPLRPVRAKVWANGWFLLLPIQVGCSKSRKSRLIKRRKRPCKGLKSRKIRRSTPTNNMRPLQRQQRRNRHAIWQKK